MLMLPEFTTSESWYYGFTKYFTQSLSAAGRSAKSNPQSPPDDRRLWSAHSSLEPSSRANGCMSNGAKDPEATECEQQDQSNARHYCHGILRSPHGLYASLAPHELLRRSSYGNHSISKFGSFLLEELLVHSIITTTSDV